MAFSIKNEETSRAVAKLAALTGLTMTEAIRQAVEEKIARLDRREDRIERILAIGRDCASRLPDSFKSQNHTDILFGDDGLPK